MNPKTNQPSLATIRKAVANYIRTEGCSCCEGFDHKKHQAELAKLLKIGKYKDGSGYNFTPYETKQNK